ncbi:MAG: alkaline phosphatase family protein, partial [Phycisphaerae bacterium]|nr:alkaline phosphatase family protein [Phycisphaerae bacterium]
MWARTTPQSITLPSHVSMLTGVSPSVHGIEWNADLPLAQPVFPARPTLFELAKGAGLRTAMAVGKSKMAMLAPPAVLDHAWITPLAACSDREVLEQALRILREHRPDVLFIHLPQVDNVGHAHGWGTPEQLAAVANADDCVGQIVAAVDELGRADSTLLIVSSDHGGAGRTHGPDDPRSRAIPWIAVGPGVRPDFDLTRLGKDFEIQTYDTFATACFALGIQPRSRIDGKPIREMFDGLELSQPVSESQSPPGSSP